MVGDASECQVHPGPRLQKDLPQPGRGRCHPRHPVKTDDRGNVKFDPRNTQLRGLEIITNDRESPTYRQSMMAMSGVKVTTRYVP
ncbi:restriction endonuclease fold toxin-2 domain-containing protein [Streptomyces sp. NPDC007100]|uniref:restriction endonuclease fold toxin-2 domain-containing protein n=1 Tax=Streptomyces sp. NPDC007100 TaxID=3155602 RepID=UPI0033C8912A